MIHIPALIKLISKNKDLKKFIQSSFKTKQEFYKIIRDPNIRFIDIFKKDPYLKGLVLGYGQENAKYFCRRSELINHIKKYPYIRMFSEVSGLSVRKPNFPKTLSFPYIINIKPHMRFATIDEEWNYLKELSLNDRRESAPPFTCSLPCYVRRKGKEAEALHKKYIHARAKLTELFFDKPVIPTIEKLLE